MADKQSGEVKLVVLTPTRKLVDVVCDEVYFPSTLGRLGILPGHAALVCQMGTGVLYFNHGGTTTFMSVSGGVADVKDNVVTLLVDVAEDAPSIDVSRAEKALQRAQLARSGRNVEADIATAGHDEARALARIEAATLHSGARKV
ncbi:MAG: ATP synthase F1 subunit epsilon [Silvanigrellales bacterium]|jgi:F-type H+-transporting ATPase subunit epsilon|nr:ATP synthase F1 subunit epsilon [Silvanigrellales bacterium]